MSKISFGVGIATGTEGLMYPVPYASVRETVNLSIFAESLGFDSVWGNDHISTQNYVREKFKNPPRFYSPLLVLSAIAEQTSTIKVCTGLLVMPFRHPLIAAKEIATLDHLSNGRLLLGVGLGAYREEFEAEFGKTSSSMHRGEIFDESLIIIKRLFKEDIVSYSGKYFDIQNAQSFPKPLQDPFPFYFGGNSNKSYERVVRDGTGWLPALLTPDEVREGYDRINELCEHYGRNINTIDIAPQLGISIAKTHEEAVARYKRSQMYLHSLTLGKSTMKGRDATNYLDRNLIGSVDEIKSRIALYKNAGLNTFSALIFTDSCL
ncbi:MAG: LLM class flavin-dependent oxidoreductase, partial [Chloroflexi bacterium]|nr:LLM class flavin-dependent oxidoreductase [Chloroflexota bacterium]